MFNPQDYGNSEPEPIPAAERSIASPYSPSTGLAPNGSPLEMNNTSTIPYEEQPAASRALGIAEVPGSIETRNMLLALASSGFMVSFTIAGAPYFRRGSQE